MNKLDIDPIVVKFFVCYSQFEYALKELGYIIKSKNYMNDSVSVDWKKFVFEFKEDFNPENTPELKKSVRFLLEHPPEEQIVVNNKLKWRGLKLNNKSPIDKLCLIIKTVRNNLFHGGKLPYDFA